MPGNRAFQSPKELHDKLPADSRQSSGGRDGCDADRHPPSRGAKSARHDDAGMPARQKGEKGDGRSLPDIAQYARENMPKKEGAMLCQHNPLKFMVGRARFERATLCLKGRYSTY